MKKSPFVLVALALLALPAASLYAQGLPAPDTSGLEAFADAIIDFINDYLVYLLGSIALIVFLYGVANAYIFHPDNEEARTKGHQYILWGIIGFVVIFSLWAIINLVSGILGLTPGGTAPAYPTL